MCGGGCGGDCVDGRVRISTRAKEIGHDTTSPFIVQGRRKGPDCT